MPQVEQPTTVQILGMTLLVLFAWLPLIPYLKPVSSGYIALLLLLRLAALRWPVLTPGRWFLLPLTLAGIISVFGSYFTLVGQNAGTALLSTMLALKLLEVHKLRDLRIMTILFGFLLISQFLFDQSPQRALYLALLLVLNLAVTVDLSTRAESGLKGLLSSMRTAGKLSLQALPLALVLFVLFPRLNAPLWSLPHQADKARSGMKDWLEPGSISQLILSGEPAFRVKFDSQPPAEDERYWRSIVLWHTDGQRWTRWPAGKPLGRAKIPIQHLDEVSYRVELEPTGKRWLFALDLPLEVEGDVRISPDFQVLSSSPVKGHKTYRATSALDYNTAELQPSERTAGTQLPRNVTPRMRALITGWQRGAVGPEQLVQRGLAFFREEPFYYTLLPPKLGPNPADTFLFETRKGFCEHYASSFALLMRIGGIPSRIVLGYMGGEYNPIGDYFIVRQSDAHAWVEVWLDEKGWVRVDPTASVAPGRVERSDLLNDLGPSAPLRFRFGEADSLRRWAHNLSLLGDAIQTGWRDWVVGLSSMRQQRMLDALGFGSLRQYGRVVALVLTGGLVLLLLLAALTRPARSRDPLQRIYARFCDRLARVGMQRKSSEGPLDYSRRVTTICPGLRDPIDSFMALYLPQRYGRGSRRGDFRELAKRLREIRPRRFREP